MEEITCTNCGKTTPKNKTFSSFKLKNQNGYCRFCESCKDVFDKAVANVSELVGQVFEEGILVELGKRDPFFRIKLMIPEGELYPRYVPIHPEKQDGGLMVFVKRCNDHLSQKPNEEFARVLVPVKIVDKKETVAIAEPVIENK